jgi:hypothetical protein
MSFKRNIAAIGLAAVGAASASAAPVLLADNGHYYEYVGDSLTWGDALATAATRSYAGRTGYLATITSDAENSFLYTLSTDGWIGATDQAVEGEWRWAAGPETGQLFYKAGTGTLTYAHWNINEPNNLGGENVAQYNGGGWNDLGGGTRGYFVEYSGAVPEPATWAMALAGFGAVGSALRRRQSKVKVAFA